jgi:glutaredoxin
MAMALDQSRSPQPGKQSGTRRATLYRMMMKEHVCPYGLKSKDLLEREGFEVEDHWLTSREEVERFKRETNVSTTPQTFIDGERVGGYDDLREHFGKTAKAGDETTFVPVITIFSMAALLALAASWNVFGSLVTMATLEWFMALSVAILAIQKLQDIESFSTMFLNYDLLAQRWLRYAYIYPFGEALVAIAMLAGAGALLWLAAPIALFIGTVGAVSVFKAVYIDKRELKCACVGGASRVPLGFVSLTENLFMVVMGLWMGAMALS